MGSKKSWDVFYSLAMECQNVGLERSFDKDTS